MLTVIIALKLVASAAALFCAWASYGAMVMVILKRLDDASLHIRDAAHQRTGFKVIFFCLAIIMLVGVWVGA